MGAFSHYVRLYSDYSGRACDRPDMLEFSETLSSFWGPRACFEECRCLRRLERIGGAGGYEIVAMDAIQRGFVTDFPCRHTVQREHQQFEISHTGPNSGVGPHRGRQRLPFYIGHLRPRTSVSALVWVYANDTVTAWGR